MYSDDYYDTALIQNYTMCVTRSEISPVTPLRYSYNPGGCFKNQLRMNFESLWCCRAKHNLPKRSSLIETSGTS